MATSLKSIIRRYEQDNELSGRYVKQLEHAVGRFAKYLGRKPTVRDLKVKRVNKWLRNEQIEGAVGDRTRSNIRQAIATLWKQHDPKFQRKKIRRVKVAAKNPNAWSFTQFKEITDSASQISGVCSNGIERSALIQTMLWFTYETGLRRSDVWAFEFSRFAGSLKTAITQHKVSRVHIIEVTQKTHDDMESISNRLKESGDNEWNKPLRWPDSESQFYYWMRKVREIAGVDSSVVNRCLQHIRRTGATAVEMDGGKAWQYLGHAAPGLDRISYVDGIKTITSLIPQQNRDTEPVTIRD